MKIKQVTIVPMQTLVGEPTTSVRVQSWFENPVSIITALTAVLGILRILGGAYPDIALFSTIGSILVFILSVFQSVLPPSTIKE